MGKRLAWLDLARVIAIILVVGFHAAYALTGDQDLRPLGFLGASLFFVISGFALATGYPGITGFDLGWLKKRYFRIATLYYPALIAVVILFSAQTYYRGPYDLALHFLFLNFISHDTAFSIISPAWFIVPLVGLYILYPFLNGLVKRHGWTILPVFLVMIANRLWSGGWVSFSPLFFAGEFCFGIAMAGGEKRFAMLGALLTSLVNPVMAVPYLLFLVLQHGGRWADAAGALLRPVAERTMEIFLFHEAFIMVLLGEWNVYGLGIAASFVATAAGFAAVMSVSARLRLVNH